MSGNIPDFKDILKIIQRGSTNTCAQSLTIKAGTSSGPFVNLGFNFFKADKTSFVENVSTCKLLLFKHYGVLEGESNESLLVFLGSVNEVLKNLANPSTMSCVLFN